MSGVFEYTANLLKQGLSEEQSAGYTDHQNNQNSTVCPVPAFADKDRETIDMPSIIKETNESFRHGFPHHGPMSGLPSSLLCDRGIGQVNGKGEAQSHQNKKDRTPPLISPPPLKRQRMSPIEDPLGRGPVKEVLGERSPKHLLGVKRFPRYGDKLMRLKSLTKGVKAVKSAPSVGRVGLSTRQVHSAEFVVPSIFPKKSYQQTRNSDNKAPAFLNPNSLYTPARDDDEMSMSSVVTPSVTSTGSGKGVSKCRVCQKGSTKTYDPLIRCPVCLKRQFHEGCRKPPLKDGANWDSWSCFVCIQKARKGLNSVALTPTTLTKYSLAQTSPRDRIGPNLPGSARADEVSSRTPKVAESPRVEKSMTSLSFTISSVTSHQKTSHSSTKDREAIRAAELSSLGDNLPKLGTVWDRRRGPKPVPLDETTLMASMQNDELDRMILESTIPNTSSNTIGQPFGLSTGKDCLEIPNTPTQKSSQIQVYNAVPRESRLNGAAAISQSGPDDSSLVFDQSEPKTSLSRLMWCPVCQKQRIFAKPGVNKAMWQPTPQSLKQLYAPSMSWNRFGPGGLVGAASKKIVTKRLPRGEKSGSLIKSPPEQLLSVDQENSGKSKSHDYGTEAETCSQNEVPGDEARVVNNAGLITGNVLEANQAGTLRLPGCLHKSGTRRQPINFISPLPEPSPRLHVSSAPAMDASTCDISSADPSNESIYALGVSDSSGSRKLSTPGSANLSEGEETSPGELLKHGNKRSSSTNPRSCGSKGTYTFREMIGMALLAAQGLPLTAKDIGDWIRREFPHKYKKYQKGKAVWMTNIGAILSQTGDFRKERKAEWGAYLWNFENARTKQRYVAQFPEYSASEDSDLIEEQHSNVSSLRPQTQDRVRGHGPSPHKNSKREAIQIVDDTTPPVFSHVMPGSMDADSQKPKPSQQIRANNSTSLSSRASREADDSDFSLGFEKQRIINLDLGPDVRLETDFYKAFPEFLWPSIEYMTQVEIEQKIEEIRKRPSRKARFGKPLALARSHRLDVHDELADSRKRFRPATSAQTLPLPFGKKKTQNSDVELQPSEEGGDTFKDVFNFPKNPIPIVHDGQLAFRDGTLVNSKLPRSRVVYKVGRFFAGDLRL
ncbi:uncharacterized protein BDR25DRAFT_342328 [Lindgomyces ingoldianus]|uniref:Uncharacterized protein n=1 Tax=Lindgomyces ingoldianus TaxID=673940 RepID=A0ACB6QX57_9PLEO|nr:uncharacterized protein BDR25DRAFT_342328 [Lindgomyces ingoldianus]KAF2471609.1 hypothetical protein BDR25DRAFT_342328 [Lindgomyces ingoldianus]